MYTSGLPDFCEHCRQRRKPRCGIRSLNTHHGPSGHKGSHRDPEFDESVDGVRIRICDSIAYYNFPKARRAIGHLVTACTQNHITKRLRSHVFVKCSYFKLGRSDTSVGDLRKRYGLSPPSDLRVCVLEMSFASYSYVWFKTE